MGISGSDGASVRERLVVGDLPAIWQEEEWDRGGFRRVKGCGMYGYFGSLFNLKMLYGYDS